MVWSGDKSLWDHLKIRNKPEKAVYFTSFGSGTFRPIRTAPNSPFTAVVAWQTITVIVTNICWEKTPKIDQHTKHHNTQNQYWSSSSEEEYIIIKMSWRLPVMACRITDYSPTINHRRSRLSYAVKVARPPMGFRRWQSTRIVQSNTLFNTFK